MAAKYQLITELYRRTGRDVTRNPQAWQGFLSSACHNYKCRFDEQLLIYAQRPDATAVAEIGTWNRLFKGWVNKDSKGIAVFDPKGRRNTLKYYFDVSDTHAKLRKSSIEMEAITLDNVYKIMQNFGKLYAIMSDEEKKSLITYLIKEIQIYPNGESEMPLKSIEFNFPIYIDGKEVRKVLWERGNTVETIVLIQKKTS